MNKQELVTTIAEKSGLTKKDSQLALEAFVETIEQTVATESVVITGFGKFETIDVAEKSGVCKLQGTEKPWTTEAYKKPVFRAGKNLKEICK